MKTYDYKDLLKAFQNYWNYRKNDYFEYHVRFYEALKKAFGVDIEKPFEYRVNDESWINEILRSRYLIESFEDSRLTVGPLGSGTEAPERITRIYHKYGGRYHELQKRKEELNFELQCEIFKQLYGKTRKFARSSDLLKYGFDDTEEPPDPYECF
ncbi:MAG: hypothetical protein ACM3U1_00565 [Chloroflexota bacterium]